MQTIRGEQYCVCFSEIARVDSSKYYVTVRQDDQLVTAFEMKRDHYHNQWVVCQPAPDWILQQGTTFASLIEEASAQSTTAALPKKSRRKQQDRLQ